MYENNGISITVYSVIVQDHMIFSREIKML